MSAPTNNLTRTVVQMPYTVINTKFGEIKVQIKQNCDNKREWIIRFKYADLADLLVRANKPNLASLHLKVCAQLEDNDHSILVPLPFPHKIVNFSAEQLRNMKHNDTVEIQE